ncbi:MAG: hypothetical protein F6K56_23890, partial [Moorea sp. SIO3G5]|nr:hypothetical protein [Moorena sp. SIO3G5]
MNIDKIQLDGDTYSLNSDDATTDLASKQISWLITQFFDGRLELSNCSEITSTENSVTFTGDILLWEQVLHTATVQFTDNNNILQLKLTASPKSLGSGWTFSDNFPGLVNSDIDAFSWNSVEFIFSSYSDSTPAGLYFYGVLSALPINSEEVWAQLSWLLTTVESPVLEGPIQFSDSLPVLALNFSNYSPSYTFSDSISLELGLSLDYLSDVTTYDSINDEGTQTTAVYAYTQITSEVSYTDEDGNPVVLPIYTQLDSDFIPPIVGFTAETANAVNAALSGFTAWVGVDLTSYASTDSFLPAGISLTEVNFSIGKLTQNLEQVSLNFASTSQWTIIADIFTLESVAIDIDVTDPMSGDRSVSSRLRGTLSIAGVEFNVYAQYPDFYLSGGLAVSDNEDIETTLPDTVSLLNEFLPTDSHEQVAATTVDSFSFFAYPSEQSYELSIALSGGWDLLSLDIYSVNIYLQYQEGLTAKATARLALSDDLSFSLSALYNDNQWYFSGSTTPDTDIAIYNSSTNTGLLNDLASLFNTDTTLPAVIDGLLLKNVDIAFETNTKNFRFSGELDFTFSNSHTAPLYTHIDIERQQDATFEKSFSAELDISDLTFDVAFDESSDSKLLVAGYSDATGTDISLADLLADFFSSVSIPDVLQFTLHDATFV